MEGINNFPISEYDFTTKEFHSLVGLYKRVSGLDTDLNFLTRATAVVVKNKENEVVGGFFYGPEDLNESYMNPFLEYVNTENNLYVTYLSKDPDFKKEIDMVQILLDFIKRSGKKFWGIVEKDNQKLLAKYNAKGIKVVNIKDYKYDLVLF